MPRGRILVVDDERDIVEIVCDLLAQEGYRTLRAYDGEEAWEVLQRERPDALVLDIKMPRMDGLALIRRLRGEGKRPSLPVVVLTATQVIRETEGELRELGVTRWIAKPFEPENLLAAVASAVRGKDG